MAGLALVMPVLPGSADGRDRVFLIDATPDIRQQLHHVAETLAAPGHARGAGAAVIGPGNAVDGVLLTHAHIGHYLGLAFFGFEAMNSRNLPVHCTATMAGFLSRNGPWSQLVQLGNIELREFRPGESMVLGAGLSVTAIPVPHRNEYSDTVGFIFRGPSRTVFYVPDTEPWTRWRPGLVDRLTAADLPVDMLVVDGTFYSGDELPARPVASIGHPLMIDTMDLLQELVDSGRLTVAFTHLNHSNPTLDPDGRERRALESRGYRVIDERERIIL